MNGRAQFYSHEEGRVAFDENNLQHWQYKIADHLGNTMVMFEDKDGDGSIMDENQTSDPELLEVLQRNLYYPFGMEMDLSGRQSGGDLEWFAN